MFQEQKNKLVESIEVFRAIQNNQCLSHATFILFLNKFDVFKEKIKSINLIDHFENFPGKPNIFKLFIKHEQSTHKQDLI